MTPVASVQPSSDCLAGRSSHSSPGERRFDFRQPFFERSDLLLLRSDCGVLFLKFVEEHRVQQLILDGFDLPVCGTGNQIRVDLSYLLRNQSVLNWFGAVLIGSLVPEGHRAQPHQPTAGVTHVLNVLFVASGRGHGAKVSRGVDQDRHAAAAGLGAVDASNESGGLGAQGSNAEDAAVGDDATVADINVVGGGGDAEPGAIPDSGVVASGVVGKRRADTA